jgi:putative cell wall-binding protein
MHACETWGLRCRRRLGVVAGLLVCLSMSLLLLAFLTGRAAASATPSYLTVPLGSTGMEPMCGLDLSSTGRVVWVADVNNSVMQVFTWTSAGGTVQLTSGGYLRDSFQPRVSGDRIVYKQVNASLSSDVVTWTSAGGASVIGMMQLAPGTADIPWAQVDGDRVVWQSYDGVDYEMFTWTPGGGTVQITDNSIRDESPQVSGDRVVWLGDNKIYTWTPSDGVVQLTSAGTGDGDLYSDYDLDPAVSGNRVVWTRGPTGNRALFTWTPDGGIVQLTDGATYDVRWPRVSGDRVAWSAYDHPGSSEWGMDVFTWTPAGGAVQLSSGSRGNEYPSVDGDCVTWIGYGGIPVNGYLDGQVYAWTPTGGVVELGSDAWNDGFAVVVKGRIAWTGTGSGQVQTASAAAQIAGVVEGDDSGTVALAGAIVSVSLSSSDPNYDLGNAANNLIGTATAAPNGAYVIDVNSFRTSGLPVGSIIDVTASMTGCRTVKQTGTYDRSQLICSFRAFDSLIGPAYEDRRLPVDDGLGTLSYTQLLPDHIGPSPTVTGLSRNTGPSGGQTTVVITGTGLTDIAGPGGVTFGGIDALSYTVDSSTQITAVSPAHVRGRVSVQVNLAGGGAFYSAGKAYLYVAPTVIAVSPTAGPSTGGDTVVITGTNLSGITGADGVTFGGTNAASYTVDSLTQITAVTPAHASGKCSVIVKNAAGETGSRNYTYGPSTISQLVPSMGTQLGGTTVRIIGKGFVGVPATGGVTIGGLPVSYTVDSPTQITAVTPAHAAGWARVVVTTSAGATAENGYDDFRYGDALPFVSSVEAKSGPASGRATVTISGSGFTGLSGAGAVQFGGVNAASYTVDSPTTITAVTPAQVPGSVQVEVTNVTGASVDTLLDDYTFVPSSGLSDEFTTTQITTTGYVDGSLQVSGDRVVWLASPDGSDAEIYTWTPSGGVVQVTDNEYYEDIPAVSGDGVAWSAAGGSDGGSDCEVFTWTPSSGIVQITADDVDAAYVNLSGARLVWMAPAPNVTDDYEIFTWTPTSGTVRLTSNSYDDLWPHVSGDRVAWTSLATSLGEAWTWTPGTGAVKVYQGDRPILFTIVSGDRVTCLSTNAVLTWDPTAGATWIDTFADSDSLDASGERLVWDAPVEEVPGEAPDVYSWTPSEGTVRTSATETGVGSEEVSGDRAVWVGSPAAASPVGLVGAAPAVGAGAGSEIYTWTPGVGVTQVTHNAADDIDPVVSGSRIAWVEKTGDNSGKINTAVVTQVGHTTPAVTYASIRGSDRYDTAIRLSKAAFPTALPADSGLVLAPGETFPEALCGAPLAAAYGGPVLLNPKTGLGNAVKAELRRLAPKTVFCIGFPSKVVDLVKAALPTAIVKTINGSGSAASMVYDMSRKVANALAAKVGTSGKMTAATAIITPGDKFPDALGVSPLACAKKWPIILTPAAGPLNLSAAAALSDLGITKTIRVGTYVGMPAGVTLLASLVGSDRYQTNVKVATWAKANAGLAFTRIGVATGDKFPDALAAGPYLANGNGILLLAPLLGPLQPVTSTLITTNRTSVQRCTFVAMIEPVVGRVKALLP